MYVLIHPRHKLASSAFSDIRSTQNTALFSIKVSPGLLSLGVLTTAMAMLRGTIPSKSGRPIVAWWGATGHRRVGVSTVQAHMTVLAPPGEAAVLVKLPAHFWIGQ